jgi:hypothetical protein
MERKMRMGLLIRGLVVFAREIGRLVIEKFLGVTKRVVGVGMKPFGRSLVIDPVRRSWHWRMIRWAERERGGCLLGWSPQIQNTCQGGWEAEWFERLG